MTQRATLVLALLAALTACVGIPDGDEANAPELRLTETEEGYYDELLGVECIAARAYDGDVRCVPTVAAAPAHIYVSPNCKLQGAVSVAKDGLVELAVSGMGSAKRPLVDPPRDALAHLFLIVPYTGPLYRLVDQTDCVEVGHTKDEVSLFYYTIVEELSPELMVEFPRD